MISRSKYHCLIFCTVCLLLLLLGCQPSVPTPAKLSEIPSPAPQAEPMRVKVDFEQVHQTIRYVAGGNFIHKFAQISQALDPIGQLNVNTFQPRLVRLRMELEAWEPINDNQDPTRFDQDAFQDSGTLHAAFQAMQLFSALGAEIIFTAWDVPDWMVSNPVNERGRIIPPENRPELVESIAAFLVHARDVYGVEVDYISFNEPDIGVNVSLSPQELITIIRQAGARFTELGLKTRWLIGDCSNMKDCLFYLQPLWQTEDIRPYLGPAAFHSWDAYSPDASLKRIREFAVSNGLEVWCTEAGWDSSLWQNPQAFPGWNHGIQTGIIYARVLKLTGASALFYWEMLGEDYPINDGRVPYPVMHVIEQFHRHFSPGMQIVGTSPDEITLYTVAAKQSDRFSQALVNLRNQFQSVQIEGLPDGVYSLDRVSSQGVEPRAGSGQVQDRHLALDLPPSSVNFLSVDQK